jgi:TRAP-type C4-dicarboxylate transport system substrate-binding protein
MKLCHALAALSLGVVLAGSPAAQEVILKVHHFWPPGAMGPTNHLAPWCDKIGRESGNRLKCQIFPAMQLGGTPPQLIDQVRDGVADIVWTLPGYTAGRYPIMEVFELPFMTNSAEAASRAAWDYYNKYAVKEFAGIKPLAFHVHDQGYVHTRDRQIKTLADFKGLKLRAPTRQTNRMLAAFGATPVAMPLPAVTEAMSKGVIDGFVLPWEVIPSVKLQEMVKFHTETDAAMPALYTAEFIFAMNPKKYESLPADLKAVIDRNSGAELSQQLGALWDRSKPPARKTAVDRGNTFYTVPATELSQWERATRVLYADWINEMNKRGLNGNEMLSDARAMIAKYDQPAGKAETKKAAQK